MRTPTRPRTATGDRLGEARDARRLAEGDEAALRSLYGRYGSIVYGLCLRQLGDSGLAEECTQDVFASLWRSVGTYDPDRGRLSSWLFAIARNRIIDESRRRSLRPAVPSSDEWPEAVSADPAPHVLVERTEAAERMARAMAALPEAQLEVLQLAYFHELSQSEIAERVGIPLGTVKGRLRLAMNRMRELLVEEKVST